MTAFRFVTLVCDRCFTAFDPGTALTEADARADAADAGWSAPSADEDRCGRCTGTRSAPADVVAELEIGEPIPVVAR
ncbi:MAG: hypothetical protein J0J04_04885 [Microbacterium sp.]|uniref:hypothetical protein n=1 Tax=Microbacterium sp. TaxID=51671 RepID=UPI001ACB6EF0|nr:hypothetical protein [Microbacterium sp.]MBN9214144.1 hypothetical protein [Microbacterium sp.]